jgi:hypothetical protein
MLVTRSSNRQSVTDVATSEDTAKVVPPSCGWAPSGTGTNEPGQISLTHREPRT